MVMKYPFHTTAVPEMSCAILNSWTIGSQHYKYVTDMAIKPRCAQLQLGLDKILWTKSWAGCFEFGQMRLDEIAQLKFYNAQSVSGLNIIYLWFEDTDSNSDYVAGVAKTRLGHVTCAAGASLMQENNSGSLHAHEADRKRRSTKIF